MFVKKHRVFYLYFKKSPSMKTEVIDNTISAMSYIAFDMLVYVSKEDFELATLKRNEMNKKLRSIHSALLNNKMTTLSSEDLWDQLIIIRDRVIEECEDFLEIPTEYRITEKREKQS